MTIPVGAVVRRKAEALTAGWCEVCRNAKVPENHIFTVKSEWMGVIRFYAIGHGWDAHYFDIISLPNVDLNDFL